MSKPKRKSGIRWWVLYLTIATCIGSLICMFIACALHMWFGMAGWFLSCGVSALLSLMGYEEIQNNKGNLW